MKILICGPASLRMLSSLVDDSQSLPSGYEYPLAAYLARLYHEMGHEVSIVSNAVKTAQCSEWSGDRMQIYLANRRRHFKFTLDGYSHERREMQSAIQRFKPDVIHAQWTYEFAHTALDSGFPYLVTARDAPWTIAKLTRSPYRYYRAMYANKVIPRLRHMSAISDYVANTVKQEYNVCCDVHLIPNGLRDDLFQLEELLPTQWSGNTFVSVSGWDPRKNVKSLLQAFAKVRLQADDARLLLIGGGLGEKDAGANWARKRKLDVGVQFLGHLDHSKILTVLRNDADYFVHSTLEESFCMTVLEAMAQGVPVVALPDSGAVPWLLDRGKAGILALSQRSEDLAEAMLAICSDAGRALTLSRDGYARAKKQFTLESVAKQYLKVYEQVIEEHGQVA